VHNVVAILAASKPSYPRWGAKVLSGASIESSGEKRTLSKRGMS
jgi:hypothetical protein